MVGLAINSGKICECQKLELEEGGGGSKLDASIPMIPSIGVAAW